MALHCTTDLPCQVYRLGAGEPLAAVSLSVKAKAREASTDPILTRCRIATGAQQVSCQL